MQIRGQVQFSLSVFRFRAPNSVARACRLLRQSRTVTEVDLANVRILVVEDELDALDLITIDLTEHGAKVRGASSAAEALDLLRSDEFDLMISDIGMADTDGYNLIKQVRRQEGKKASTFPRLRSPLTPARRIAFAPSRQDTTRTSRSQSR